MTLYAESSAVLAWLLDEPRAEEVLAALAGAETIVASDLTLIECERTLIGAAARGLLSEGGATDRRAELSRVATHWNLLAVTEEVVERARRPFPTEPIRTLDALHLASALFARTADPEVELLSLDRRIRDCGRLLGFRLVPD